jgi:hypothetical protein
MRCSPYVRDYQSIAGCVIHDAIKGHGAFDKSLYTLLGILNNYWLDLRI